jgi:DNA topoisomerase-3
VPKTLVITEKPSVARDIAASLGGFAEHEGYSENDEFVVTFAVGHLLELLEPDEIDPAYKRWTLDNLPILPQEFKLKPKSGQSERLRTIKRLAQREDVAGLVNACDAGREGELIFREIVKHLGIAKPIRRLWLQSMTDQAIRSGFSSLRPGAELEGLAAAAECRSFADWLIGMNATRALTKRLKSRREKTAWSAGRVQTPTLALLVDREIEVLAHVPRPYWRVTASFDHEGNVYTATWFDASFREDLDPERKDDRIFDETRAAAIVAAVRGASGLAEETRKPSRESAPPLFDLTSLQREANRRFGWSAKRTLGAAQRCYEAHKILTYPRTDSRCLPSDYRETVRQVLVGLGAPARGDVGLATADYASAARHLLEAGLQNEARTFDDGGISDHFAIIPTGVLPGPGLSGDDRRLFDLVVRRFLGAFYPPALWMKVERTTRAAGESFRTRARSLQEPGWRAVLVSEPEEDEAQLPPLRPGVDEARDVSVAIREVNEEQQETRPPARITEARLLSLMENAGEQIDDEELAVALHEKGIGTPATRADIIENLIAKGYVVRVGKALRPTVKGVRLIDILRRIHVDRLASARLTGELEKHLGEVEHGQRSAAQFMSEIEDYAREIVEHARNFEYDELYANEPPLGPCPVTGRPVRERAWFYSADEDPAAGEAAPKPMLFWKDTSGRYLNREVVAAILRDGKSGILDGFTARDGRTYRGILEIDRENWKLKVRGMGPGEGESASATPEYDVDPTPLGRCPFDEDCQIVESPTLFVCERKLKEAEQGTGDPAPKSCGFQLPRTVCKREITRVEAIHYLQHRRTELLTDFTSRFGRPFSATLVLRENGRHGFEFLPRERKGKAKEEADAAPASDAAKTPRPKTKRLAGPKKAAARKPRKPAKAAAKSSGSRATPARAPRKARRGASSPD